MIKKEKFLVIGSNSFSGSHFVSELLDKDIEKELLSIYGDKLNLIL